MRRLIIAAMLGCLVASSTGCFPLNMYSSDPQLRMNELLNQSEDLRQARLEWRRFWMIDQPSHLTPERV
ncbi:MAG TPA: hypothetical protein PKD72_16505, partial [Gemmatales bacterium]|nr:hypothetical protein [Gemmatales bacterium]